jgi:hypothetical protein
MTPSYCCAEIRKRKGGTRWGGCGKPPIVCGIGRVGVMLAYCKRHANRVHDVRLSVTKLARLAEDGTLAKSIP